MLHLQIISHRFGIILGEVTYNPLVDRNLLGQASLSELGSLVTTLFVIQSLLLLYALLLAFLNFLATLLLRIRRLLVERAQQPTKESLSTFLLFLRSRLGLLYWAFFLWSTVAWGC